MINKIISNTLSNLIAQANEKNLKAKDVLIFKLGENLYVLLY